MAEIAVETKKKGVKHPQKPPIKAPSEQIEPVPKQISFFQRIAAVPLADWGTRAKVRVYRLEPLIDTVRSTGKKYITIYDDGPPDEERIKQDHGSGRYRLYFGMKSVGAAVEREVDSVEIDILDPKFPPRLDLGDWLDDPKNRRWAWAKSILEAQASRTAQQQQPQSQGSNTLETLQVFNEIQDSVAARLEANKPPAPVDPIEAAVKILNLTKGGGDTVLMQMFASQLEHSQKRAEKLEDELRARNNPAPVAAVDPIESLTKAADGYKKLKELFGGGESKENGSGGGGSRSRMGAWMEFFQPVLPEVAGIVKAFAVPLAGVMAQKMMQRPQPNGQQQTAAPPNVTPPPQGIQQPTNGTSTASTSAPPPPQPNPDQQGLRDFIERITPPMLNHLSQGLSGEVFASFVADGWGTERVQQMQLAPPEAIVQFYQGTAYWEQLRDREKGFLKFLREFQQWKPEEDEDTPSDGEEEEVEVG